jgi:Ca2+-binding EF-hand superfamily protein
LKIILDF